MLSPKTLSGLKRSIPKEDWKQMYRNMRRDSGKRLSASEEIPKVQDRLKAYKAAGEKNDTYKSPFTGKHITPRKSSSAKQRDGHANSTKYKSKRQVQETQPPKEANTKHKPKLKDKKKEDLKGKPHNPKNADMPSEAPKYKLKTYKKPKQKEVKYKGSVHKPKPKMETKQAIRRSGPTRGVNYRGQIRKPKSLIHKHWEKSHRERMKVMGGMGAALGMGLAVGDNEQDDALSSAEKMLKYASLGVAADYGFQIGYKTSKGTMQDLGRKDMKQAAKKVMTEAEELRWQKSANRKLGVAYAIGLAAFGAATILDVAGDLEENRKATKQKNEQEQAFLRQQANERRQQDKMGYGYVDYGQIVLSQWEKRIGHYAMGNAKFN